MTGMGSGVARSTRPSKCYIAGEIAAQPTALVFCTLETRPEGLSQDEATRRLQQVGRNSLVEIKGQPLVLKFLSNFTHLMALLL
jgi:Ca2+-transporting ATPase